MDDPSDEPPHRRERAAPDAAADPTGSTSSTPSARGESPSDRGPSVSAIGAEGCDSDEADADGPTDAEVADAKTYLTGSFPLSLDSNENIAGVLQSYQVTGRGIDYVNKRNGLIEKVTKADVVRVTQRLFDPEKFVFVVVGQPDGLAPTP